MLWQPSQEWIRERHARSRAIEVPGIWALASESRVATGEDEAARLASEIGFPVVLKVFSETVTPVTRDIADLKRGECEGGKIAASSHNPKDHAGPLRTGGLSRPAGSPQEGRPDDASDEISRETEGENRRCN
jgi:hypothetical protein